MSLNYRICKKKQKTKKHIFFCPYCLNSICSEFLDVLDKKVSKNVPSLWSGVTHSLSSVVTVARLAAVASLLPDSTLDKS